MLVSCLIAQTALVAIAFAQPAPMNRIDPPGGAQPVLVLDTGGHTSGIDKLATIPMHTN